MNTAQIEYIKKHWQLLIHPEASRFIPVINASPLASVAAIATELQEQDHLSLSELAERTQLHKNTVAQITRSLDGKLFQREQKQQTFVRWIGQKQITQEPNQVALPEIKSMKFRCTLPEKIHFRAVQSTKPGRWVFEDCDTSAFKVISPVSNPWGKDWKVLFSKQFQKGDKSKWLYQLKLVLHAPDQEEILRAEIIRERYKSVFSYNEGLSAGFYSIEVQRKIWVSYSVIPL